jgi:hypothetical protein
LETDYFGCVGRLCLLDVAIPDMHISLFFGNLYVAEMAICGICFQQYCNDISQNFKEKYFACLLYNC